MNKVHRVAILTFILLLIILVGEVSLQVSNATPFGATDTPAAQLFAPVIQNLEPNNTPATATATVTHAPPTSTFTPTPTVSNTPTATFTPSRTRTNTPTATATQTLTASPTATFTLSPIPTDTFTPDPNPTPTPSPLFTSVLILDGNDDVAVVSHPSLFNLGDDESFTIEFFFFVDNGAPFPSRLEDFVCKELAYCVWGQRQTDPADNLRFSLWVDNSTENSYFHHVWLPNGWHYLAATYDHTTQALQLYYNGNRQIEAVSPDPINVSTTPLLIGRQFRGAIEMVRISNIVRYTDATMTVPTSPWSTDGNTIALWLFDEAAGSNQFQDQSANNLLLFGSGGAQTGTP